MKKLISIILMLTIIISLAACAKQDTKAVAEIEQAVDFTATVTGVGEKAITVTPDEGSNEIRSADIFDVGTPEDCQYYDADGVDISRDEICEGSWVKIVYGGDIQETYPASIRAYEVWVLEYTSDLPDAENKA